MYRSLKEYIYIHVDNARLVTVEVLNLRSTMPPSGQKEDYNRQHSKTFTFKDNLLWIKFNNIMCSSTSKVFKKEILKCGPLPKSFRSSVVMWSTYRCLGFQGFAPCRDGDKLGFHILRLLWQVLEQQVSLVSLLLPLLQLGLQWRHHLKCTIIWDQLYQPHFSLTMSCVHRLNTEDICSFPRNYLLPAHVNKKATRLIKSRHAFKMSNSWCSICQRAISNF